MKKPSLWELFGTFLRIGAMGFGGTFALVALMQKDVVEKGWMSEEEFAESTGMAGLAPGPISSNTCAVVGYRLRGWSGGLISYVTFHAPAVILVIFIAAYFKRLESLHAVQGALKGLFAAVVGLLVAVGWKMGRSLVKDVKTALLAVLALLATIVLKANPVLIVLGSGVAGYLLLSPKRRS